MKLQESGENYLETILILEKRNGIARSVDVATELGFSKPSVSRAVSILKEGGYVTIGNIGQLLLTDKGRQVAQNIYDRHCFIKECLMFLGMPYVPGCQPGNSGSRRLPSGTCSQRRNPHQYEGTLRKTQDQIRIIK